MLSQLMRAIPAAARYSASLVKLHVLNASPVPISAAPLGQGLLSPTHPAGLPMTPVARGSPAGERLGLFSLSAVTGGSNMNASLTPEDHVIVLFGVFGDLADDKRFAAAYRSALASLHRRGARATLESLA